MRRVAPGLTLLGIAGILLYPPLGLVLYGVGALARGRPRVPRPWLPLWGAGLGALALAALVQGSGEGAVQWLGTAALLLALAALRPPRLRTLALGALLAATSVAILGAVEVRTLNRSFLPPDGGAVAPFALTWRGPVDRITGLSGEASGFRRWHVPAEADAVVLTLDLRLRSGEPGWDWLSERQRDNLRSEPSGVTLYAPSATGAVVRRRALLDRATGGDTFRGRVVLRAREGSACGHVGLTVPGSGLRERTRVCADRERREVEVTWDVPEGIGAAQIDLLVTGFGGATLELSVGELERWDDGWEPLAPLAPRGVGLTLTDIADGTILAEIQLEPTSTWQGVRLEAPVPPGATDLVVAIRAERGLVIDAAGTALHASGARPSAAIRSLRARLWSDHPNLVAHPLAITGLLALLGPATVGLLSLPVTMVGLWLTGSRAALALYLLGAAALLLLAASRRRLAALAIVAAAVALIATLSGLGRFSNAPFASEATRPEIWRAAVDAIRSAPWQGSGVNAPLAVGDTVVGHAHQLVLALGVWHGLVGLVVGLGIAVGLPLVAWRRARRPGLILAAVALGLNATDFTLFGAGIAPLLIVAVESLAHGSGDVGERAIPPPGPDAGADRDGEVHGFEDRKG